MLKYRPLSHLLVAGLLLASTAGLSFGPTWAAPAAAKPAAKPASTVKRPSRRVLFIPPKNDKRPSWTVGAGTRNGGNCPTAVPASLSTNNGGATQRSLMAFVPSTQYGLTFSARPSLWIYLPETSATQVVLSLKEDGLKTHSQTFFAMPRTPGLMALTPSADTPPLEMGKTYQWAAVLICGDRPGPNDPAVTAWVQRMTVPVPTHSGTPLSQAAWYGELGIWYDALATLAQMHQNIPKNTSEHTEFQFIWTDFLKSGGIEAMHPTDSRQGYAFSPLSP